MSRSDLAALLLASLAASPTPCLAARWALVGPPAVRSGLGSEIEIGAGSAPLLFASDVTGILRSADGGATWALGNDGLTGDLRFQELVADPADPLGLYLVVQGAGVFRSDDAGRHWRNAGNGGLPPRARRNATDLVADPARPSRLLLSSLLDGPFESLDGGRTWRAVGGFPAGHYLDRLALDPAHPGVLYALGSGIDAPEAGDSLEVYKSTDDGAHLERVALPGSLAAALAQDLVVAPGTPGTVYVTTLGAGVYRSTDAGATWEPANQGLPAGDLGVEVRILAVDPTDPATLYAAVPAEPGSPATVFKSADGGSHWRAPPPRGPHLPDVRDLEVDPGDPRRVYAAPGPFRSDDGGETWRSIACALPPAVAWVTPDQLVVNPADPVILYAGGGPTGLQRTVDASGTGEPTWEPIGGELPSEFRTSAHDLALDPFDSATLFLATTVHFPSPPEIGAPEGGLFKSQDGGQTWAPATGNGLPVHPVERLLLDRRSPDRLALYAVTGGLYRSRDGATSWQLLFSQEDGSIVAVAVDPTEPDVIFVGTRVSSHPREEVQGICRSADGGDTWTCPPTDLPGSALVTTVAVDPVDSKTVAFAWEGDMQGGVERSDDGGATWAPVGSELPEIGVSDLVFDPGDPSVLWIATEGRGVFRSGDLGASWSPASAGMGPARVNDLDFGRGRLYAATDRGLFRLDEYAAAGEPLPPDDLPWIADATFPGFRFKVRIGQGSAPPISGTREAACLPETVCISGAVPGRSELFLRIVGPKPNGWLWPTLVKLSTSEVEVWIQQLSTGRLRYYDLRGASPGVDELPGLFDRFGFQP